MKASAFLGLACALLTAGLPGCAALLGSRATFTNPVLDADFPDPAVIRASDGFYYAYATQTERDGETINIQVARSADLVRWQHLGDALPAKPLWAAKTQDFWAPHVAEHGGLFYLYYSAKPDAALSDEKQGLCLAVATSARAEGPFSDKGSPLLCGPGFENIDPMAFDDPKSGKALLYWGSGFGPIKVRELTPDRLSFKPGAAPADLVHPVKEGPAADYRRLIEGAWVIYRPPFYYLFYSGDNCCGPKAHYAAMVARSRSATGPFETLVGGEKGEGVILARRGKWIAPGHNSIVADPAGQDWIVYHAVDLARPRSKPTDEINSRRVMLIDRIVYRNGWPSMEDRGPSSSPRPAPAAQSKGGPG